MLKSRENFNKWLNFWFQVFFVIYFYKINLLNLNILVFIYLKNFNDFGYLRKKKQYI